MDQETAQIAKDFARKVKEKDTSAKVILFGSRARGDNFKKSDFDFLIISNKFQSQPFIFRASAFYDCWSRPVDIEPLCYTPAELNRKKKQRGIVQQAVKEGIEIKAS